MVGKHGLWLLLRCSANAGTHSRACDGEPKKRSETKLGSLYKDRKGISARVAITKVFVIAMWNFSVAYTKNSVGIIEFGLTRNSTYAKINTTEYWLM